MTTAAPPDLIAAATEAIEQRLRQYLAPGPPSGSIGWGATPRELAELVVPLVASHVRAELVRGAVPNRVRPVDVIIVGARMTEDVLALVRDVTDGLIAAVRAEAVAEHNAELRRYIEVGQQLEAEKRVAEAERDEYYRHWQAAAEAVAAERQRIAAEVKAWLSTPERAEVFEDAELVAFIAAGSVPVATPEPWHPFHDRDDWLRDQHARYHDMPGNMLGWEECAYTSCNFWDAAKWVLDACTSGPVATPTEPLSDALRAQLVERRADPEFRERLAERVAADRPILDRLSASPVASPRDEGHGLREHTAECLAQWAGWDHAVDRERFMRTRCICGADKLNLWNYYHRGEPYPADWGDASLLGKAR